MRTDGGQFRDVIVEESERQAKLVVHPQLVEPVMALHGFELSPPVASDLLRVPVSARRPRREFSDRAAGIIA